MSKKKLVAAIPITHFSQKLLLNLDEELLEQFDHFFIFYHSKNDSAQYFFETLQNIGASYTEYFLPIIQFNRGFALKQALQFAHKENYDFVVMFQEGSRDNLPDLLSTLKLKDFYNYPLSYSARKPNKKNPGNFYNKLTNFFASLIMRKKVLDIKGDSINIYRTQDFFSEFIDEIHKLPDDTWFFLHFLLNLHYRKLSFDCFSESALEEPGSLIRLNTKWFYNSLVRLLSFFLNQDKFHQKNFSFISPSLGIRSYNISHDYLTSINSKETAEFKRTRKDNYKKILDYNVYPHQQAKYLESYEINKGTDVYRVDHADPPHRDIIVVNWCLTNICNFKCSYCPEELHDGSARGIPYEEVINFYHKVLDSHPGKKVFFEFTGGEVTYYKNFSKLIQYLHENNASIGIISNGSRKISYWEDHHKYLDHICLSFHSEQGDPEHFYEVVCYLTDKVTTHVNIMMNPEKFDICYDLAQKIAENCQVSIAMQPLLEGMDGDLFNYTPKQKKILDVQELNYAKQPTYKRNPNHSKVYRGALRLTTTNGDTSITSSQELISKGMNSWVGWECYAGVENICIYFDGLIRRGWCDVGGVQGSVDDKELKLPTNPIVCNKSQCSCGLDIMCTKIKTTGA